MQILKLHDEFGHFVRIAHNEVSVGHPDAVKKLLLAPLEKGYWYAGIKNPDYRFVAPFNLTKPKEKTELSKALATGYTLGSVLQAEDTMNNTIENLLGWMDEYSKSGKPMQLNIFLRFLAFDILGDVIFSKQFGLTRAGKDIHNALATITAMGSSVVLGHYSFWRNLFLMNPVNTWLQILPIGYIYDTVIKAISERQRNPDARFDVVAHWFKMLQEHPERLNLRNIQSQATNSISAGADTVSTALQACIFFTMKHPKVLARVQGEIQTAIGDGLCQTKVVTFADAQKLPYLQACIKEAMRFCNPVSMSSPRVAPAGGVVFGDKSFSEGTILSVNGWVIHLSEEIWGPDAREFNPDRWFRANAADLERKYFIPVSTYASVCLPPVSSKETNDDHGFWNSTGQVMPLVPDTT
ncbi:hypothetical protein SLS62_007266 [Diatrype stigma]|uniref:Cytochrome P450 n=1 Tax=Diatrype stigma TaxID=117547 RepID=A0AAN9UQ54_9PEZI